ncbi:MAG: hypothetical protein QM679_10060 [Patulibacter sp.]
MSHGKKEIRKALKDLESRGFAVEETAAGHKWGRIIAPNGEMKSVWSTPRSPEQHAKDLMVWAKKQERA